MDVTFQPQVLRWARERAGLTNEALAGKLRVPPGQVQRWEQTGTLKFSQAQKLALVTHTPFGFLFLAEPPDDRLPIPDFRTVGDAPVRRSSPDLLETIQAMQRRQAWMRDFLIEEGATPLPFVASATRHDQPRAVAAAMRKTLGLQNDWAAKARNWSDALLLLCEKIEAAHILIVINGVVGNNTRRKLNPDEFRGFVLSDPYAPLIFVNGADTRSAQMFTFAHELAHLWLGADGVSDLDPLQPQLAERGPIEQFCNSAAAEFVVPEQELRERWVDAQKQDGNFWNNQNVRVGKRFGAAVVGAAKEGRLLYQQAYQLTDLRGKTFDQFAKNPGY